MSLERDIIRKGGLFIFGDYIKPIEMIVDRVDDNIVVVEFGKGNIKTYKIDANSNISEGDVIEVDNNTKKIYVNKKKTKKRKNIIKKLIDKVFID